jgi:pectate lyase
MFKVLITFISVTLNSFLASAQILAFPGAEGWGRFSTGGRGGDVYAVTNLNNDGPGSLREAVQQGNRTVVFRVSGTIILETDLIISQSNITIAGQTAPGDGICLRKSTLKIKHAHDIIIRYLRVRPGDERGQSLDGIEVRECENVMIDHCSVSWTIDEAINTYHGTKNLTVQWCLISEPLHDSHSYKPHGFGASWGGEHTTYHHNLFAHAAGRNPSVAGGDGPRAIKMDHRNSVIYNWKHRTCDGKPESINIVNNYYKPGPATELRVKRRLVRIDDTKAKYGFESVWYIDGNVLEGSKDINKDNWLGVDYVGNTNGTKNRSLEPFATAPVRTQAADEAYKLVLENVGSNRPKRDVLDARILREVATGTAPFGNEGIIDSQDDVGGWPQLTSSLALEDADGDGMADSWEIEQGLNSSSPDDRNATSLDASYTNLEVYLNSLAGDLDSK